MALGKIVVILCKRMCQTCLEICNANSESLAGLSFFQLKFQDSNMYMMHMQTASHCKLA